MALMLRAWPSAALLLAGAAWAQDLPPVDDEPAPPTPTELAADWWTYFEAGEEALPGRVDAFRKEMAALKTRLVSDPTALDQDRAIDLLEEVAVLATRYVQARRRTPARAAPLPPAAARYGPRELLQVGTNLREARLELEFERDEAERQEQSLAAAHGRINDDKAAYLALGNGSPERLLAGLGIMRDRLAWAVRQQDLRLRRARVEALESRVDALDERLSVATANLSVSTESLREFEQALVAARAREDSLKRDASTLRLRDAGLGESPQERARARLQSQGLLAHEVETARAAVEVARLELQSALGRYVNTPGDEGLDALREVRKDVDRTLSTLREHTRIWRLSSNRERSAAADQRALLGDDAERTIAAIHRQRVDLADDTLQALTRLEQDIAGAALLLEVAAERVVQGGGRIEDVLSRTWDRFVGLFQIAVDWTSTSLFEINDTPVTVIGLFRVGVILLLAWWASKLVAGAIGRLMERRESMSRASLYTLQRLSTYGILTIGFFVGLSSIGIDFTKFALVISALGIGLGFGLQAIFSNFVAGLIILFEKSLKVGDFVELESGVHGEVREVNIRSTLITTNDNIDILVPNSEFVNGRVTNWTLREAFRRIRVPFGVAYGTDKDLVKQAALEAAEATPFTLKNSPGREPRVWLVGFGDSSLDFELVVWLTTDAVKRPSSVQAAYTWELESALSRHGIEIPFPQRDLNLRSLFGASGGDALEIIVRSTSGDAAADGKRTGESD